MSPIADLPSVFLQTTVVNSQIKAVLGAVAPPQAPKSSLNPAKIKKEAITTQ
jgi:hypothetical protein